MKNQNSFDLFINLVKNDFILKYKNSLLGTLWVFLNPLFSILLYTLIFSHFVAAKFNFFDEKYSYSIYLCSGLLLWNFISEVLIRSTNFYTDNSFLFKKISFPSHIVILANLFNSIITLFISFVLFLIFLYLTNNFHGINFISLFILIFVTSCVALSIGLLLSVFNIFFRDVTYLLNISLQLFFWTIPIVYIKDIIPKSIYVFFELNPFFNLILASQEVFFFKNNSIFHFLHYPIIVSLVFFITYLALFNSKKLSMYDEF